MLSQVDEAKAFQVYLFLKLVELSMVPTTYVVGLTELQTIFSSYIVPIDFAAPLQDRKKDMQLFHTANSLCVGRI